MVKVKDIVRELSDIPLQRNTLKSQRRALGLSRAALARILEVDPSTVYRQELQNPMSVLWFYALRGLAAEAASKTAKRQIREHKAEIARGAKAEIGSFSFRGWQRDVRINQLETGRKFAGS